eukprot:GHVL01030385.1.p1 GENE.GHVL01030385.1~~GHVL01030385.1.p1  ORF type:complete len:381 (+),score=33.49 GHVL01030385.1:84-1226(+)
MELAFATRTERCLLFLFMVQCAVAQKFMSFYDILDIRRDATYSDIKKAFRRQSLIYHPDKFEGDPAFATERFREINTAYTVLIDASMRRMYDIHGDVMDPDELKSLEIYLTELDKQNILELYRLDSNIRLIFEKNLDSTLRASPYTWVLKFYHPACGRCHVVAEDMRKAAKKSQNSNIKIGSVNCGANWFICRRFGIRSYPTLLVFAPNQTPDFSDYEAYNGPMAANDILEFAHMVGRSNVLSMKYKDMLMYMDKDPIRKSRTSGDIEAVWLVEFHKPSCPPCRQLAPALRKLSVEMENVFQVIQVDCSVDICTDIHFFPDVRLMFKKRGRLMSAQIDYDSDGHPAELAIRVAAIVLRDLVGVHWIPATDTTGRKWRDEL